MSVDGELNALRQRVTDLEEIEAGRRLGHIRDLVDAQDRRIKAQQRKIDELVVQLGAACDRVSALEASLDPTRVGP